MYGMVNQGIQQFVCDNLGQETWDEIHRKSGIKTEGFVTMLSYDDEITYRLVGAASDVLGISSAEVLETFGDFWIDYASNSVIGKLLTFGGETLIENLYNLNELHERIRLSLPHLRPPTFEFVETGGDWNELHYYSERSGMQPMVIGLIRGLARACGETVEVKLLQSRLDGFDHDIFALRSVAAETVKSDVA